MDDDLVYNALRKAVESDSEVRLVSVGDSPEEAGLFPASTGPSKKAIKACTEGEKPLLQVRDEPGTGKKPLQYARLTDKGITTLVAQTPLRDFPALIGASAPLLRTRVIRSCLRALAGKRASELDPWNHRRLVQSCLENTRTHFASIEERLESVLKEEESLANSVNEFLKATRTRIEKQKQRIADSMDITGLSRRTT